MMKLILLLATFLVPTAATGFLKLEFEASQSVKLQLSVPSTTFNYKIILSVSPNKTTTGYRANPNVTVLPIQLTMMPNSSQQEVKIVLKNNATVSKTFHFDNVEVFLSAQFSCDEETDDPWCGEVPENVIELGSVFVDLEIGFKRMMETVNIENASRIILEFVRSSQGIIIISASIAIVVFSITSCLIRRRIRHTRQSYDIQPVELLKYEQRPEYAVMISVV